MITTKDHYLRYLNRYYCVAAHLSERLEEVIDPELLPGSAKLITETINSLERQIENVDQIYAVFKMDVSCRDDESLIGFLENLFAQVHISLNRQSLLPLLDYVLVCDALMKESSELAAIIIENGDLPSLSNPQYYNPDELAPIRRFLAEYATFAK